jgi:hypothetical protein
MRSLVNNILPIGYEQTKYKWIIAQDLPLAMLANAYV